jgi:hypothetical protein
MITPPPGVRVNLACGYTDMRKGASTLAMLVQRSLALDPFAPVSLVACSFTQYWHLSSNPYRYRPRSRIASGRQWRYEHVQPPC